MSLYFDAANVLSADASAGGSFKSRVYNNSNLKSSPAQVYALIAETSKWDTVLKEVVDNAGILATEPKLTALLALTLVHDLLLARNGIAAPSNHPLRLAIERHKTRLRAEFTRCRVRRGCASVEALQLQLSESKSRSVADNENSSFAPRWVRVNNALTTLHRELSTTFSSYDRVSSLSELSTTKRGSKNSYCVDQHVPDLIALHPSVEVAAFPAYKSGRLILQDKSSCFPGYLLLGDPARPWHGDIIDACAAPGNKTTHLISLLLNSSVETPRSAESRVLSFDASDVRSKTLKKMVDVAGVSQRTVLFPGQDFLSVNPDDARFRNVTALLLDPSCSGSGIRGREDIPTLALPADPRASKSSAPSQATDRRKRKRRDNGDSNAALPDVTMEESRDVVIDVERLTKLSNLQTQIVEHAFRFPAATRVTYSTCSIHEQENENVVSRALSSSIAKQRGWRILRREDQVAGMKTWKRRGVNSSGGNLNLADVERDGCIRCSPDDEEGTGGFFVAGFVRDGNMENMNNSDIRRSDADADADDGDDDDKSWHGFSD